jgi:hypothetical protein
MTINIINKSPTRLYANYVLGMDLRANLTEPTHWSHGRTVKTSFIELPEVEARCVERAFKKRHHRAGITVLEPSMPTIAVKFR